MGLLAACTAAPAPSSAPTASAAAAQGRSRCAGSVSVALTNLRGAIADTLERLQTAYEAKPGFMGVVFDGTKPIVVVEAGRLPEWLLELTPKGIAVAPSCVDPTLFAAVKAAIPALARPDGTVSAGYDGLADSIAVEGIGADAVLAALDREDPALGARARDAIANGTLRINGDKLVTTF